MPAARAPAPSLLKSLRSSPFGWQKVQCSRRSAGPRLSKPHLCSRTPTAGLLCPCLSFPAWVKKATLTISGSRWRSRLKAPGERAGLRHSLLHAPVPGALRALPPRAPPGSAAAFAGGSVALGAEAAAPAVLGGTPGRRKRVGD